MADDSEDRQGLPSNLHIRAFKYSDRNHTSVKRRKSSDGDSHPFTCCSSSESQCPKMREKGSEDGSRRTLGVT